MYARQVLGPAFLHIMILAAGDRLVLEMQYCLSFPPLQEVKYAVRNEECRRRKSRI